MNAPIPESTRAMAYEAYPNAGPEADPFREQLAQSMANQHADDRRLREDRDKLRRALVGLVGVDTREELDQMEGAILVLASAEDQKPVLNAIHALKATL